jgi:hypothetical protein
MTETTASAPREVFAFEQAENLRHYHELTLALDADQAAEVRALIAADDHEGVQRFLDAHRDDAEVRETTRPVDLDDEQRVAAVLSVWDDTGAERDLLWES